jgi:hypothetical protein
MAPGGAQGTQNSSPGMSQPGQQPGAGQSGNSYPSSQTDQGSANQNQTNGEHKLKGCVQSQGGQTILETKKGKTVALTGQDLSAHSGHEVEVKGTWENGMSATSSGSTGTSGKAFNVTSVKMISETCKGTHQSGSMDHSSQGTGNTGAGQGTGTGNGNSTTQPPQ